MDWHSAAQAQLSNREEGPGLACGSCGSCGGGGMGGEAEEDSDRVRGCVPWARAARRGSAPGHSATRPGVVWPGGRSVSRDQ